MARGPQKRFRSEESDEEAEVDVERGPEKRRRSERIEALSQRVQDGGVGEDGSGNGGGIRGGSGSGTRGGVRASRQGPTGRTPSTNGSSTSSRQSSSIASGTQSSTGTRPPTPIMNPIVRVQAHSQYRPTMYPMFPTPASSPSSQSNAESEGSYDDSANHQVLLINAQEDFMATIRILRNSSTSLRRALEGGMSMILSNARTPNAGHAIVQSTRNAGGVNPQIPWGPNDVMAGVHAHSLPGMHRFLQSTIRRIRQRQRAGRRRAEQIFFGNMRAPASISNNQTMTPNDQATNNDGQPADQAAQNHVRLSNLFRREDGLYVITIPGTRDIITVAADATLFYQRHNGDTFHIPPHMVSYLLAKLRANGRLMLNMPSAHKLAEDDETNGKIEEVVEAIEGQSIAIAQPLRKDKYAAGAFNLIDALIRHPAILASLLKYLSASTLITLYSKSKLFQYLFNSDYERYIMANLREHMPDERIFPWRFFAKLCIYDPVRRNDPRNLDRTKVIPGLKYLSMVHYHLELAKEIRELLNRKVRGIPEACVEAMLKMSFVMALPSNASRIGIMHNKTYWTDSDLLHAWLFIIKLDMALNKGTLIQKGVDRCLPRERLFAYKNLRLVHVYLRTGSDKGKIFNGRGDQGVGVVELSSLPDPNGHGETRLLRPDQLIVQEGYARGLNLWEYNVGFMLHGW